MKQRKGGLLVLISNVVIYLPSLNWKFVEEVLNFPNGYPGLNKPLGVCWFDLLKSFEVVGPVSFNTDDDMDRFLRGNVGIIFEGTWNIDLFSEALGENLSIDPWPEIIWKKPFGLCLDR